MAAPSPVRRVCSAHDRLSAASIATAPVPVGLHRRRQSVLPRVPATPNTLTNPHTHRDTAHNRTMDRHTTRSAQSRESANPPLSTWWRGAGGEVFRSPTTHQVHPAIQFPPHPRPCSPACAGFRFRHPSRAPPYSPSLTWWRGGRVMGQSRTTPGTIRAALAHQEVRPAARPRPVCPGSLPRRRGFRARRHRRGPPQGRWRGSRGA